ncbi:MAG TPA: metal-dependent hydrolase [Bryobacteraceae bacterium]|nr:metal-dependent hydrolase [Bryobacteraceae bacterium]
MDNLTHSLTGLMLSRAGLKRGVPGGTLLLVLAANAPDMDVISVAFGGASAYFHYHRWYTHSLLLLPLIAVAPVLIVRAAVRRKPFPWRRACASSLVATATHPLMDFLNPYGIRFFLPWSDDWPGLDCTNVVDIWIWLVLLIAVLGPMLSRLVSDEIGARRTSGRGAAIAALAFLVLWNAARFILAERAVAMQQPYLYRGAAAKSIHVMPHRLNPLAWTGFVDTTDAFIINRVNLTTDFDPTAGSVIYKPAGTPAMDRVKDLREFRDIRGFARAGLLWRALPDDNVEGATRVQAQDIRFGFSANAVVDSDNRPIRVWFEFSRPPR